MSENTTAIAVVIPVFQTAEGGENLVDARSLHRFLEVDARFNDWFARRVTEYGFQPDQDFYSVLSKSRGGRPSREYSITLDMAKELAMVERNEKGRKARRYFIECEKRLGHLAPREVVTIAGETIGTNGFQCLSGVLDGKVRHLPSAVRRAAKNHAWSQVHKAFSVVSADQIPLEQMDSARQFLAAYTFDGIFIAKQEEVLTDRVIVGRDHLGRETRQPIPDDCYVLTKKEFARGVFATFDVPTTLDEMCEMLVSGMQMVRKRCAAQGYQLDQARKGRLDV